MGQTTIVLMLITILSKILGFARESVMASYIGAGELKSIYTTATTFPAFLSGILISGIVSGYIPIYNKANIEEGEGSALDFTNNILNVLMVVSTILFLVTIIFAKPIVKLLSPGLIGTPLNLAVGFTRIMGFSIFVYFYASVISGYLNIRNNFIDSTITGLILNIIIIIATIFTGILNKPYILIIGTLIANIFQYIRFPFVSKKLGFHYKLRLKLHDKYVKCLFILILPIVLSSAADQFSLIIDNAMGSAFFGKDSVSKIFYAKTMLGFITGVITMSISTVTYPSIAYSGQNGHIEQMKDEVSSSLLITLLLVIPATFGMMILANPIIRIAFERNAFTSYDTEIVSNLMCSYAPYIIFVSIIKIFSNAFYAVRESKLPVIIILIQQAINFLLNFILIRFFGLNGLAFATSISTAIGSIMIILAFYKRFGKLESMENIKSIVKVTMASIIMALSTYFIYDFLLDKIGYIFALLISVLISGILYIFIIFVFKIDEVDKIKNSIMNKLGRK